MYRYGSEILYGDWGVTVHILLTYSHTRTHTYTLSKKDYMESQVKFSYLTHN